MSSAAAMSSPAVSGRRRSRDWPHMDDTVVTSYAPAVGFRRRTVQMLVHGEMISYEYNFPLLLDDDDFDMDFLWRMFREREELSQILRDRDRKRARAAASSDDAIRRCLREARAGDAGTPEDCAVCLQDFDANARETLRVLPCSHAFHPDCIFTWLRVKAVCPLCRQDLPPQDFDDEESDDESDTDSDEDDTDSDEDDTNDGVNY